MMKRKSLTKKTRFEVFKRDSFTCQYCGSTAPDVILEVDHIKPVKSGGEDDLLNLITSCFDCNRGKKDRSLSDKTVVEKQRKQIEELNIRRQQLEMMLEWRDGLSSIDTEMHEKAFDHWNIKYTAIGWELSDHGKRTIRKLVKRFGLLNVIDAMDTAEDQYGINEKDEAFSKLGGILYMRHEAPPHVKDIVTVKNMARRKFDYYNDKYASMLLKRYHANGGNIEHVINLMRDGEFTGWNHFVNHVSDLTNI